MLVNHALERQGDQIVAIRHAVDEIKVNYEKLWEDNTEIREVLAGFIGDYRVEHEKVRTDVRLNSQDINALKEKQREIKRWNAADTLNLFITGVVAVFNAIFKNP